MSDQSAILAPEPASTSLPVAVSSPSSTPRPVSSSSRGTSPTRPTAATQTPTLDPLRLLAALGHHASTHAGAGGSGSRGPSRPTTPSLSHLRSASWTPHSPSPSLSAAGALALSLSRSSSGSGGGGGSPLPGSLPHSLSVGRSTPTLSLPPLAPRTPLALHGTVLSPLTVGWMPNGSAAVLSPSPSRTPPRSPSAALSASVPTPRSHARAVSEGVPLRFLPSPSSSSSTTVSSSAQHAAGSSRTLQDLALAHEFELLSPLCSPSRSPRSRPSSFGDAVGEPHSIPATLTAATTSAPAVTVAPSPAEVPAAPMVASAPPPISTEHHADRDPSEAGVSGPAEPAQSPQLNLSLSFDSAAGSIETVECVDAPAVESSQPAEEPSKPVDDDASVQRVAASTPPSEEISSTLAAAKTEPAAAESIPPPGALEPVPSDAESSPLPPAVSSAAPSASDTRAVDATSVAAKHSPERRRSPNSLSGSRRPTSSLSSSLARGRNSQQSRTRSRPSPSPPAPTRPVEPQLHSSRCRAASCDTPSHAARRESWSRALETDALAACCANDARAMERLRSIRKRERSLTVAEQAAFSSRLTSSSVAHQHWIVNAQADKLARELQEVKQFRRAARSARRIQKPRKGAEATAALTQQIPAVESQQDAKQQEQQAESLPVSPLRVADSTQPIGSIPATFCFSAPVSPLRGENSAQDGSARLRLCGPPPPPSAPCSPLGAASPKAAARASAASAAAPAFDTSAASIAPEQTITTAADASNSALPPPSPRRSRKSLSFHASLYYRCVLAQEERVEKCATLAAAEHSFEPRLNRANRVLAKRARSRSGRPSTAAASASCTGSTVAGSPASVGEVLLRAHTRSSSLKRQSRRSVSRNRTHEPKSFEECKEADSQPPLPDACTFVPRINPHSRTLAESLPAESRQPLSSNATSPRKSAHLRFHSSKSSSLFPFAPSILPAVGRASRGFDHQFRPQVSMGDWFGYGSLRDARLGVEREGEGGVTMPDTWAARSIKARDAEEECKQLESEFDSAQHGHPDASSSHPQPLATASPPSVAVFVPPHQGDVVLVSGSGDEQQGSWHVQLTPPAAARNIESTNQAESDEGGPRDQEQQEEKESQEPASASTPSDAASAHQGNDQQPQVESSGSSQTDTGSIPAPAPSADTSLPTAAPALVTADPSSSLPACTDRSASPSSSARVRTRSGELSARTLGTPSSERLARTLAARGRSSAPASNASSPAPRSRAASVLSPSRSESMLNTARSSISVSSSHSGRLGDTGGRLDFRLIPSTRASSGLTSFLPLESSTSPRPTPLTRLTRPASLSPLRRSHPVAAPTGFDRAGVRVARRMEAWISETEERRAHRAQQAVEEQMKECSFRPSINPPMYRRARSRVRDVSASSSISAASVIPSALSHTSTPLSSTTNSLEAQVASSRSVQAALERHRARQEAARAARVREELLRAGKGRELARMENQQLAQQQATVTGSQSARSVSRPSSASIHISSTASIVRIRRRSSTRSNSYASLHGGAQLDLEAQLEAELEATRPLQRQSAARATPHPPPIDTGAPAASAHQQQYASLPLRFDSPAIDESRSPRGGAAPSTFLSPRASLHELSRLNLGRAFGVGPNSPASPNPSAVYKVAFGAAQTNEPKTPPPPQEQEEQGLLSNLNTPLGAPGHVFPFSPSLSIGSPPTPLVPRIISPPVSAPAPHFFAAPARAPAPSAYQVPSFVPPLPLAALQQQPQQRAITPQLALVQQTAAPPVVSPALPPAAWAAAAAPAATPFAASSTVAPSDPPTSRAASLRAELASSVLGALPNLSSLLARTRARDPHALPSVPFDSSAPMPPSAPSSSHPLAQLQPAPPAQPLSSSSALHFPAPWNLDSPSTLAAPSTPGLLSPESLAALGSSNPPPSSLLRATSVESGVSEPTSALSSSSDADELEAELSDA